MIPRFKPWIGAAEFAACLWPPPDAVTAFEDAFARAFEAHHGLAFAYGRSALWAFCKALGLENAELVMPAYTCSVVAHAITLSGNTCRFVDIDLGDYNMSLQQVEQVLNERTRAIIATHLFGYPLDVDRLEAIVLDAERRFGHRIWVIQDCAHAFGTRWQGRLVAARRDAALFGFNISKTMTSIFGGMLTTNDDELAARLRTWRNMHLRSPHWRKAIARRLYLAASTVAFSSPFNAAARWAQDSTRLLDRWTKAYHLDGEIRLPPDFNESMLRVEAQVGLAQLKRYPEIERRRREHATAYLRALKPPRGWQLPPSVSGATYSHFPVRVPDRGAAEEYFLRYGIQVGHVIEYSVPHLRGYLRPGQERCFPNSQYCSEHLINLPVHPQLTDGERTHIVNTLNAYPDAA